MPNSLRAVTFDFDGLMVNTEDLYVDVMNVLCSRRQLVYTDELRHKMMGRPGLLALQIMIEHHDLAADTPEAMIEESDLIFGDMLADRVDLMPGLLDLLDELERAEIPRAIGTSSRRKYVDYVVERFGLAKYFSFILSAENVTHGKPNPEIYLLAAAKHGVQPSEMMVLEDSQNGSAAAIAAGTFVVAVPSVHTESHDFSRVSLVAKSLADPAIRQALGIGATD